MQTILMGKSMIWKIEGLKLKSMRNENVGTNELV